MSIDPQQVIDRLGKFLHLTEREHWGTDHHQLVAFLDLARQMSVRDLALSESINRLHNELNRWNQEACEIRDNWFDENSVLNDELPEDIYSVFGRWNSTVQSYQELLDHARLIRSHLQLPAEELPISEWQSFTMKAAARYFDIAPRTVSSWAKDPAKNFVIVKKRKYFIDVAHPGAIARKRS